MDRVMQTLPEGYELREHVDLQQDKATAVKVNVAAVLIMAVMAVAFHFLAVPVSAFFGTDRTVSGILLHTAVLLLGYTAYIVLHELTHAAVMKALGARKVRFGFNGLYAWAGSEQDLFRRTPYLLVAMAPVLTWGVIFGVLRAVLPTDWSWVIWSLQIGNVAGAAGDLYVTFRFIRLPADALIRDTGVTMDVYGQK